MAVLRQRDTARRVTLGASTLVGRSSQCTVRLASSEVSGQHAALYFGERGWALRDLGSRNGTFVEGVPAPVGERLAVAAGATLRFADEVWVLESDGPPVATAVGPDGRRATAVDGLLPLPDPVDPVVTVFASRAGRWIAERDDAPSFVEDGAAVVIDGAAWVLELPPSVGGGGTMTTPEAGARPWSLATVRSARVAVSRDEETIALTLLFARGALKVPQRAHHGLLRVLAQARADDAGAAPAEQGWMYTEAVCAAAAVEPERLYVDVYRARKQLAALGLPDAADLIERRAATRQIRLGIARVQVVPLVRG